MANSLKVGAFVNASLNRPELELQCWLHSEKSVKFLVNKYMNTGTRGLCKARFPLFHLQSYMTRGQLSFTKDTGQFHTKLDMAQRII